MTGIAPGSHRGGFHYSYAVGVSQRSLRSKVPRLLECLLCVAQLGDPEYHDACEPGEFAVVDFMTKEKAWFERPPGATNEVVTGMVESTFAAVALQVLPSVWIV